MVGVVGKGPVILQGPSPLRLSSSELAGLLEKAEVLRAERTAVAGMLRVLDLDGSLYVQEETPEGHALLRPRPTTEAAMAFVDGRLRAYERMWDG